MSGHYCSVGEGLRASPLILAVLGACAAAALVFAALPQAPTQHWTTVNSRVGSTLQRVAPAPTAAMTSALRATRKEISQMVGAPQQASATPSLTSQASTAAFAGSIAMLLGSAVLYARQLMSAQKPESLALLATSSEAEDKQKMRQLVQSLDSDDMRLLSRGGSMTDVVRSKGIDEVAQAIRAEQISRKDLTPKDVILEMQRGNGRFWMGLSERPEMDAMHRRALIMAQAPKICILSCSDSRVPVEIIFDQGLGEVFVVRMAGNILDANAHGSIEFSVKYLGVKVVLVIGHEGCGAVKGAIGMSPEDIAKEPFDLQVVLQSIRGGLDVKELNGITDARSREREAIVLNTSNQVKKLQQNQLIADKVADGSLLVAGAFYEISSGIVDFFSLDKNGLVIDI